MTGPRWTHLAETLPWLRGQGLHIAGQSAGDLIADRLPAAGFTLARARVSDAAARYRPLAEALRLPASAADNLDALADALRDLPERWPGCLRLALLVERAGLLLHADLLGWTELCLVLRQASDQLWQDHQLVFGTVLLVPEAGYGVDLPS